MPPPGRRISGWPSIFPPPSSTREICSTSCCARWLESGLAPERLELEIAEASLLDKNHAAHLQTMRQLKSLGVSMVLDNCGTGYSSASYLTGFPFDKIKIDRSVAQGFASRRDCAAVVASVLALAHGLDIATAAKGVESRGAVRGIAGRGRRFCAGLSVRPPGSGRRTRPRRGGSNGKECCLIVMASIRKSGSKP